MISNAWTLKLAALEHANKTLAAENMRLLEALATERGVVKELSRELATLRNGGKR